MIFKKNIIRLKIVRQEAAIVEFLHSVNDIIGDVQSISGRELRQIEEWVAGLAWWSPTNCTARQTSLPVSSVPQNLGKQGLSENSWLTSPSFIDWALVSLIPSTISVALRRESLFDADISMKMIYHTGISKCMQKIPLSVISRLNIWAQSKRSNHIMLSCVHMNCSHDTSPLTTDNLAGWGIVLRSHWLLDGKRGVGLGVARHEDLPIAASADIITKIRRLEEKKKKLRMREKK